MSVIASKPWLRRFGLAALATVTIGLAGASPAAARVFFDIGIPLGVPYYAPPAYYYPPPAPVVYGGCGYGWRYVPPHYDRWGRWIAGHCRPW